MFCKACKTEKDADAFYKGVRCRCRECHKVAMRILRLTNPAVQERERARAKRPERRAHMTKISKRWRENNPAAYKAQTAVGNAIRDGKLHREPCAICGTSSNVHAHHSDYSKPLMVRWLCAKCHHRLHASFPELGGHFTEAAE